MLTPQVKKQEVCDDNGKQEGNRLGTREYLIGTGENLLDTRQFLLST